MSSTIAALFHDADTIEKTQGAAAAAELYKRWIALNPEDPHLAAAGGGRVGMRAAPA